MNRVFSFFKLFGLDFVNFWRTIKGLPFYISDFVQLKKQRQGDKSFPFGKPYPALSDRFTSSGVMSGHYFHQDLLIAKKIFINNPKKHLDIGSRMDGFVAHVASFREIDVIDIRPQVSPVSNINFTALDLMKLPDNLLSSYDSISSLHVIEHFGLGRYNDPVDYNGHLKAFDNIYKILKVGGRFYFSAPIGPQRIEFNAHRVFSLEYLLSLFKNKYNIVSFAYVNDLGDLFENITLDEKLIRDNCGCTFGCGIFELIKR